MTRRHHAEGTLGLAWPSLSKSLRRLAGFSALWASVWLLVVFAVLSFGFFEPWEIERLVDASKARQALPSTGTAPVLAWLEVLFSAFARGVVSKRLSSLVGALVLVLASALFARRYLGKRSAFLLPLLLVSDIPFLLHATLVGGSCWSMLVQLGVASTGLYYLHTVTAQGPRSRTKHLLLSMAALCGVVSMGAFVGGVLRVSLPPLLALAVLVLLRRPVSTSCGSTGSAALEPRSVSRREAFGPILLPALALVCLALVVATALSDPRSYSYALGGSRLSAYGRAPSIGEALQTAFYALVPWSVLFPLSLCAALRRPQRTASSGLGLFLLLWLTAAWLADVVHGSRYGGPQFLAFIPALALVALSLDDLLEGRLGNGLALTLVALCSAVVIRDLSAFPEVIVEGAGLRSLDVSLPKSLRAASAGVSAVALLLVGLFAMKRQPKWIRLCRLRLLVPTFVATSLLSVLVFFALRDALLGTVPLIVIDGTAAVLALVAMLSGALIAYTLAFHGADLSAARKSEAAARPQSYRSRFLALPWPKVLVLMVGLLGVSAAATLLPRIAYDASSGRALAYLEAGSGSQKRYAYRVPERTLRAYGVRSLPVIIRDREVLKQVLRTSTRSLLLFPRDEFARLNHLYREDTGNNLPLLSAFEGKSLVASLGTPSTRATQNPLHDKVSRFPKEPMYPVEARWGRSIVLRGFDISSPDPGAIRGGSYLTLIWHWYAKSAPPADVNVLVRLTSEFGGDRNADHEPIDGLYGASFWLTGDHILDRHSFIVPAHFGPGRYELSVGLLSVSGRLKVKEGDRLDAQRVRAGHIELR